MPPKFVVEETRIVLPRLAPPEPERLPPHLVIVASSQEIAQRERELRMLPPGASREAVKRELEAMRRGTG